MFRDEEMHQPAYRTVYEQHLRVVGCIRRATARHHVMGGSGALWMLLAAVGLLLALVLFNLGNLLLTRNINRFREFVVREALGPRIGNFSGRASWSRFCWSPAPPLSACCSPSGEFRYPAAAGCACQGSMGSVSTRASPGAGLCFRS